MKKTDNYISNLICKYVLNKWMDKRAIAQQQFGKMAGLVLNSTVVLQLNFCAKLNFCASISATSPSCKTLNAIYFPNLRIALRSYFFARKLMEIVIEKSCVIMENWNQTLCWKSFLGKFSVKSKTETKLCEKLKTEPNFVD